MAVLMADPRPPWHFGRSALAAWLLFALFVGAALAFLVWLFLPLFW